MYSILNEFLTAELLFTLKSLKKTVQGFVALVFEPKPSSSALYALGISKYILLQVFVADCHKIEDVSFN